MEGIVLGRVGHYFDAGNGSCSTALIVDVSDLAPALTVTAWNHDGTPFSRTSVPLEPKPAVEDTSNSFHLNRDCPWSR